MAKRGRKKSKKKVYTCIGVGILLIAAVYVMYFFFVQRSLLNSNYSTDKKIEYIALEGQTEKVTTQKYMSDLGYTMRYDVENFKVFKHGDQDIYSLRDNESVGVIVEKTSKPNTCHNSVLVLKFSNCFTKKDAKTDEYYIYNSDGAYKITVKTPGGFEYEEGAKKRIRYMLNSFELS